MLSTSPGGYFLWILRHLTVYWKAPTCPFSGCPLLRSLSADVALCADRFTAESISRWGEAPRPRVLPQDCVRRAWLSPYLTIWLLVSRALGSFCSLSPAANLAVWDRWVTPVPNGLPCNFLVLSVVWDSDPITGFIECCCVWSPLEDIGWRKVIKVPGNMRDIHPFIYSFNH